jgi:hypothetical protein
MHTRRQVLARRIHSNQFQRLIPLGNELMLRPSGNNNDIASLDFLILACDSSQAAARCEHQNLVDGVHLLRVSVVLYPLKTQR